MTQITNENFGKMLPIIKNSIKTANFIAIDTELTGLVCNESCSPSLFDSVDERYEKQRISVSNFIICQFGISLFTKDIDTNIYHSKTYSFYLCPRSLTHEFKSFRIDLSAIEFLAYNQFDFNNFARKGISYLNEIQEQNLRENFNNYLELDFLNSSLNYEKSNSVISKWIASRKSNNISGTQMVLKCKPTANPLSNFAFLYQLRNNFDSIWIQEIDDRFIVKIVNSKERTKLLNKINEEIEEVINKMLGFSLVFQCMVESKKPIIGHNMIMDLLMIYHHFYRPLPKKLIDFKSSLHSLFPYIFDTKSILFNERKNLSEISHIIKMKGLGEIYTELLEDEIANSYEFSPKIQQFTDELHSGIAEYTPHDAGFDAYATGFVFAKIGHILLLKNQSQFSKLSINWFEVLKAIENHCNKVNLIRANLHYMCIGKADPLPVRPQWLYAIKKSKDSKFSISKLSSMLSNYGTADIKQLGTNVVLIAVNNYGMSRNILKAFRNDVDIKVTEYNVYKHNPYVRLFLWSTIAISSCVTSVLTMNLIKSFKH